MIKLHTDYPLGINVVIYDDINIIKDWYEKRDLSKSCGSCAWFVPHPDDVEHQDNAVFRTMHMRGICLQTFPLLLPTTTEQGCECYEKKPHEYTDRLHDPVLNLEEEEYQRLLTDIGIEDGMP